VIFRSLSKPINQPEKPSQGQQNNARAKAMGPCSSVSSLTLKRFLPAGKLLQQFMTVVVVTVNPMFSISIMINKNNQNNSKFNVITSSDNQ